MPKNHIFPETHFHETLDFPKDFLWGAATSAHQVEGGNDKNDWWAWEKKVQPVDKQSGQAVEEYQRYEEDFDLAKNLGHNTHRLSVEWSRIEPEEGKFNQTEIDHYKKVLKALKDRQMTVMLTLWHFTIPLWLSNKGGWENGKSVDCFNRFVQTVVPEFKDYVDFWIVLNEPNVYEGLAYWQGKWPPQKRSLWSFVKVTKNLASAYKKSYAIIHRLVPTAKVGIANHVFSFSPEVYHSLVDNLSVWFYDILVNHSFYLLTGIARHDFLGVNYYIHQRLGKRKRGLMVELLDPTFAMEDVSDLGWEIYPEGIFKVLSDLSCYNKPLYITENGIASTNDDRRTRFFINYLKEVYHAVAAKIDVRGYIYWSLIDNFEWAEGFSPRFGLIEVDYATQKRTVRTSALVYQDIIKNNGIRHKLLKLLGHTLNVKQELAAIRR